MTSLPSFGWSNDDIGDQSDRLALITGANSGLGYATAKALAEAGARIVMAVRTPAKGESARSKILESVPGADVVVEQVDLSSLDSVRAFAARFLDTHDRLDLCINNAGVMATPPQLTEDGIELQFASNHLGHFALVGLVLPRMLTTPGSRVVSVSSLAANSGSLIGHDGTSLAGYERFGVYGTTKLANQVFTVELNRRLRLADADVLAVVAHPGLSSSNLVGGFELPNLVQSMANVASKLVTQPASIGALPTLRAAVDPKVEGGDYFGPSIPGQMYGPPKKIKLLPAATNRDTGAALWQESIDLSGVDYAELD